jgi:transcriptional regulator with XRE-family HTH domain
MKTAEREQARELRRTEGLSLKVIARRLGVSVSSVSRWVRDIELTDEQAASLLIDAYNGHVKGRAIATALHRQARLVAQEHGRMLARQGNARHASGCMLYWAEGSKRRNQVVFSNSDPEMIRFFVEFLRTYFAPDDKRIRVTCNLFADHLDRQREN